MGQINNMGLINPCSKSGHNRMTTTTSVCTAQVILNASVTHLAATHAVCAVRTPLEVDWKIFFVRREPMLSVFFLLSL